MSDNNDTNDGSGANPKPTTTGGAETIPSWVQQIIESNKMLSERLNKLDAERTTENRKKQLSSVYEKLPEALRKPYERISVDTLSDEDFTTLIGDIKTEVDGLVQTLGAKGAVFGRPATHNAGSNKGNTLTKEQEEAINVREGNTSGDAQPF